MANTWYATSPVLGLKISVPTSDLQFALGTKVLGNNGTEWVYVQASGAITAYDCVGIDEDFQCAAMTKTIADDGWTIGFAQYAFTDNYYGWVALKGSGLSLRVAASCAADVALYTTGTGGVLDDTSASQTMINGCVIVTAGTSSGTSTREVLVTNPWATVAV